MDKFLTFTIVGLSLAAIYAVIASGLVLTYTTTGIFNFAHGAAGMLAAFTVLAAALRLGLAGAGRAARGAVRRSRPLFGVLLEVVIMRGLQGTTETVKLVVSISLLLFMIGLAQLDLGAGREPADGERSSQGDRIDLGPTTITCHQAITIGVAIVVAIGLRIVLTRSRIGIAMRAAVDDRPLAALNGARPDRVSMLALGDRHARWPRSAASSSPRRHARRRSRCRCSSSARTPPRSSAGCAACRSRSSARSSSAAPRATSPATCRRTSTCPACGSRARRSSSSSCCWCCRTRACAAA